MTSDTPAPGAEVLYDALLEGGATHLVGLPDSFSAVLIDLALATGRPRVVPVTREGEAFAVASGLWLGGAIPVVVIQNTGLMESGDALRGTAVRMAVPLLTLVTWRGYGRLRPAPGAPPATEDLLVRADLDSTGILTEPTLDAWRIPHAVYASDADVGVLRTLWDGAHREGRPAALLLPRRLVRTC